MSLRPGTLAGMKPTEFYRWVIDDPDLGCKHATGYRMTAAEALRYYPGATPIPGSLEVRLLPETDQEAAGAFTSAWRGFASPTT